MSANFFRVRRVKDQPWVIGVSYVDEGRYELFRFDRAKEEFALKNAAVAEAALATGSFELVPNNKVTLKEGRK